MMMMMMLMMLMILMMLMMMMMMMMMMKYITLVIHNKYLYVQVQSTTLPRLTQYN